MTKGMQNMNVDSIRELLERAAGGSDGSSSDMSKHRFWTTQPVPRFDDVSKDESGPIEAEDPDKVPKEPYSLIKGFEWVVVDMENGKEVQDVYDLLFNNYVEDDDAMFRFKYSAPFLNWALKSPGWRKEWHIGIRASQSKKLVAFISAVPITLRIRSKDVKCAEVNFLCIHKKLRAKRLAPVLIKEITRRCNLVGIWQAIYTAGVYLPTPVATCRYYHRSLDWEKLHDVGFAHLPAGSTKLRQTVKYKLPDKPQLAGLRSLKEADIPAVRKLLEESLGHTNMAQRFDETELKHWLLDSKPKTSDQVIYSYVVEQHGRISDFVSFYRLESTIMKSKKHDTIKAAYLFYYATDVTSEDKAAYRKRLNDLMHEALILAKAEKFDVMNALTLLDNPLFLEAQKFAPGDGKLHYYLYNYRTAPIGGGINAASGVDATDTNRVGMVML